MSHMAALNDNNWGTMLQLMNTSMSTLSNQLEEAKRTISEREIELREMKEKNEKNIRELTVHYETVIAELKERLAPHEERTTSFKNFTFDDVFKPKSYAAAFYNKAIKSTIEKFDLTNGSTEEERRGSLRKREEAAREVLELCNFTNITDEMVSKTRNRISSSMADAKYYRDRKEEIIKKRNEKKRKRKSDTADSQIENNNADVPVTVNNSQIENNNADVHVPVNDDLISTNSSSVTVIDADVRVPVPVPVNNSQIENNNADVPVPVNDDLISTNSSSSVPVIDNQGEDINTLSVHVPVNNDDDFDPKNPNKIDDFIVGNIVGMAFFGEKMEIYYGKLLRLRTTGVSRLQIKYFDENDDGSIYFSEKPEITWEPMKYAIHCNLTLEDGHIKERKEVVRRYKLYSDMWF